MPTQLPPAADRRADVVVVGAGPAGSAAAWHLAKAGRDVLVLEKASFPRRWLATLPPEWQLDEEHAVSPVRGAGLPMALHRQPAYTRGLLLAGDAAGAVNPFNGEGISYAMETGRMAAEAAIAALARPEGPAREEVLRRYPTRLRAEYGGHHRLGLGFLALLSRPGLVRFATAHGLKRPPMVRAALRLMGNLTDGADGDRFDRVVDVLTRLAPAV